MTRHTKLARKTHEEAAGFQVTALRPSNADETRSKAETRGKKRCHEEATEQNSDDCQSSQAETSEGMQTKLSKRQRKIIAAKKKRQGALAKVEQEGAEGDKANGKQACLICRGREYFGSSGLRVLVSSHRRKFGVRIDREEIRQEGFCKR